MVSETVIHENQTILYGIQHGEVMVLTRIFTAYKRPLLNTLAKYGAQPEEAEDIFMSGLEAIHERLQTKELNLDKSSFKTYFTQVCLFQWSKIKRRKKFISPVTIDQVVVWSDMNGLEEEWSDLERKRLLQDKMSLLSTECRQILEWFFSGEKSSREIADLLGIPEGNARKRKYDCKERLFKLVKNDPLYRELI